MSYLYPEDIPITLLTCSALASESIFVVERSVSTYNLVNMKHTLEDALVAIDTAIALQRAGWDSESRRRALKARGNREFKLFCERQR